MTAVVGLTVMRLHQGLHRQTVDLGMVAETQLMKTLDSTALLAKSQVDHLYRSSADDLRRIANRNDVVRAVSSRNLVAIWYLLGRLSRDLGFDNVLVVDPMLRVFGAADENTDILAANEHLQRSALAGRIRTDITEATPKSEMMVHQVMQVDEELKQAIGAPRVAPMAFVAAVPVLDDFGETIAVLVGHRALRQREPSLDELARISGGVLVVADGKIISTAGEVPGVQPPGVGTGRLIATGDNQYWSRCTPFDHALICAVTPQSELAELGAGMVRVGEAESLALSRWLIIVALVSLIGLAGVTFLLSQRFARPLSAITNAVRGVARGDWKASVPALHRQDEIGNIARAVTMVQRSLEERDRLRLDMAHAETAVRRREHVEAAIRPFDRKMRTIMLDISETLEAINEVSLDLERYCGFAEGEILEAAFVCRQAQGKLGASIEAVERVIAAKAEGVIQDAELTADLESAGVIHSNATAAMLAMTNLAVSLVRIKTGLKETQETSVSLIGKVSGVADGADRLDATIKTFLRDISDKPASYPASTAA
jgi:HAMP domain-containing protein